MKPSYLGRAVSRLGLTTGARRPTHPNVEAGRFRRLTPRRPQRATVSISNGRKWPILRKKTDKISEMDQVGYWCQSFMPPCGTRNDENGVGLWWPMVGGGCRVGGR